ncbi:hypothetical protein GU926_11780 [Nibribacter ruber]|uniref:DUF5689 domain-containing protein n=1 Tax=Nibribacter ruber TaxID=2698458 RepID=A0A6P1P1Q8_9BACT|nr:hypothetical protein [Nibribacter ruber]QHL88073.1 hypothetical protein GU926_11780 [Nibribacter ruber]
MSSVKSAFFASLRPLLQCLAMVAFMAWSVVSCTPKDEEFTPEASAVLRFEADTVVFDTVFTVVGSVTKRLKVYNSNKNAVRISEIKVAGMGASPFQVFVNGRPGPLLESVEVRGGDSLLLLVKATINPTADNQPFLVRDSIQFLTNGNQQQVILEAYGQNAAFYRKYTTGCAETWTASKAHVIYDSVTVPAGCTLIIEKGAQIHLHKNAKLKVLGTLLVRGEAEERVRFQQVRQEEDYRNAPGQWQGIELAATSTGNRLQYTEIKNAVTGIFLKAEGNQVPSVTLEQTFIKTMLQSGILSHGGNVTLINSIITNTGEYALAGLGGGLYKIYFSTLANYANEFVRFSPSFVFSEELGNTRKARYQVEVVNSILWGRQDEELQFGAATLGSTRNIRHSFIKTMAYATELAGNNNQINVDPKFRDAPKFDFQIIKLSPANKAGIPLSGILLDYEAKERDTTTPDVGALEVID